MSIVSEQEYEYGVEAFEAYMEQRRQKVIAILERRTGSYKKKRSTMKGFINKMYIWKTLYDVVQYIFYHDKYMLKNNKSRNDMLFGRIEQERVTKEILRSNLE